jgi:Pyruvate kinase, barrel domain
MAIRHVYVYVTVYVRTPFAVYSSDAAAGIHTASQCVFVSAVIATIGPASHRGGTISEMISTGMSAARFDLSCGSLEYHLRSLDMVHDAALRAQQLCAMVLDVPGRTCVVDQPCKPDADGWPEFSETIRIFRSQRVILTTIGDMKIPKVRVQRTLLRL